MSRWKERKCVLERDDVTVRSKDLMTGEIISVGPEDSVIRAAKVMDEKETRQVASIWKV